MNKLTEQEQSILDNAPEGAVYYIVRNDCADGVDYHKPAPRGASHYEWDGFEGWDKEPIEQYDGSIADLRKKQGKTVVEAVFALGCDIEVDSTDCIIYMNGLFQVHDFGYWMQFMVCSGGEFNQCVKDMSRHNTSFEKFQSYLDSNTTLEPVKARVNVEYVKVTGSAYTWEVIKEFEEGACNFYIASHEGGYTQLYSATEVLAHTNRLYRKVETEIKTEKRWIAYEGGKFKCEIDEAPTEYDNDNYQIIEITVDV